MKRRAKLALVATLLLMPVAPARTQTPAPTETNFQVTSTADLVHLCEAAPDSPMGIAALHFCQGFAVGAYQYHQIATMAQGKRPLVCAPSPPPSRDEVTASFIAWAKQNPQVLTTPPVEGLFRYLAQHFPCRA